MKSIKTLMAVLLAMAFVGTASATTTTIHICGSTAFRAPVTAAIMSLIGSSGSCAYDSSSTSATAIYGANEAVFSGTLPSGDQYYICTFWTGSLAGVVDLVTQQTVNGSFIPTNVTMSGTSGGGTNVHGLYTGSSSVCDVAMSDSFYTSVAQSVSGATISSPLSNTYPTGASLATAIDNATIHYDSADTGGDYVGVVPFVWETGRLSNATSSPYTAATPPFTNMTQQTALTLIKTGYAPVSMLDGNVNDGFNYLILVGRNEDSGTRIGALAESQDGLGNAPKQYQLSFSPNLDYETEPGVPASTVQTGGTSASVTSIVTSGSLWPGSSALNTEPDISWTSAGHSGYVGGGDVSNVMAAVNNQNGGNGITFSTGEPPDWNTGGPNGGGSSGYFVAYLGVSDAVGGGSIASPANSATVLSYNGVTYTVAAAENGQYSFWTFEHLYWGSTIQGSTDGLTVVKNLAKAVYNTYAPTNSSGVLNQPNAAGIIYNPSGSTANDYFYFQREVEGGEITPNY